MDRKALNFTRAALAALPIPGVGKRAYYRDTKTRGLAFGITDKGTRSYVYYRKIDGRPSRILIGRFEEISIEDARNEAARLNAAVAKGWTPQKEREQERSAVSLDALFVQFIEQHGKPNMKFSWQYERQFERYFKTTQFGGLDLANLKARDITRAHVAQIFGSITAAGHPQTANRVLAMISSVFNWGVRNGLVEINPADQLKKHSERKYQRDRFLTHREMPYFFQAVTRHPNEVMRDYVMLSLLTGQRQANVLAMEWTEIDFHEKLWRIPSKKTKTSREYLTPLIPEAMEILERRRREAHGKFVLQGIGATGHFADPRGSWAQILLRAEVLGLLDALAKAHSWTWSHVANLADRAEFELAEAREYYRNRAKEMLIEPSAFSMHGLRLHDLRRTLASWQASTGASLVAISKTLNHANVATTSIYARLQTDPIRHAIENATSAILRAANGEHSEITRSN